MVDDGHLKSNWFHADACCRTIYQPITRWWKLQKFTQSLRLCFPITYPRKVSYCIREPLLYCTELLVESLLRLCIGSCRWCIMLLRLRSFSFSNGFQMMRLHLSDAESINLPSDLHSLPTDLSEYNKKMLYELEECFSEVPHLIFLNYRMSDLYH